VPHVDLIVSGSVLVTPDGGRIGKGEGYSDLEFATLAAFDAVSEATTTTTTVHESQLRNVDDSAFDTHDVPIDVVCTPEQTVDCRRDGSRRPDGIDWDALGEDRLTEIPVLERLAAER
jgi:5-formyltetrahydrofolate cyclo-ligase